MPVVTVGTSAVQLANEAALIQNLGAGVLYIDITSDVTTSTGAEIAVGDAIPVGGNHTYYGISDSTCDAHVLPGGMGAPSAIIMP